MAAWLVHISLLARNQKNNLEFHAAEEPNDFYIDVRGLVGTVPHCIELSDDDGDGGGDGGGEDERSMKSWAQVSWEMVKLLRWTHHSRWTPVWQVAI